MPRILIIEDDDHWKGLLCNALASGYQASVCSDETEGWRRVQKEAYDVILMDLDTKPERSNEIESVQRFCRQTPHTPVIVTSRMEKAELIVQTIKAGASDFLAKPYSPERVKLAIHHALENRSLKNEIDYLRRQQDVIYDIDRIIAKSPSMRKVISVVHKLAGADSTLLMTGETGTGKSLLSGAIHFNSPRRNKPFTKINCANLPETLLESELFGHEKGAFTGATKTRAGRLEQANGGTVFLDEIGELPLTLQAKLLRVMEEKAFERLGENRTIYSDIRIIAATNRNLEQEVSRGTFREDLYYRINVFRIHLPPLRERRDCIEPLGLHLLAKICRSVKKHVEGFAPDVFDHFRNYAWPGNIRELSNTIERAVIMEDGPIIRMESVSLPDMTAVRPLEPAAPPGSHNLNDQERQLIVDALEKSLWIQKDAATLLGVTPRALHYKIKKYEITHPRWYKNH